MEPQPPQTDEQPTPEALRSAHTRLVDELRPPLDDADPQRARSICAQICRDLLGDLAPSLTLLPAEERRRVQAVAAFARTLFDFAVQPGLEGGRLAQINRWEFELETALAGQPRGQPVFLSMAAEDRHRRWPRRSLDEIVSLARRAATVGGALNSAPLARPLYTALTGQQPSPEVAQLVATCWN